MLTVQQKTLTLTITLGTLTSKLRVSVTDVEELNVVLGLNRLRQNKPHVNWFTSTIFVSHEGVYHKIYSETVDLMMNDHIFVQITKTLEEQDDLSNIHFSTCTFERIHF